MTESIATLPMWIGFIVFIGFMLALDLFVFGGRKTHRVTMREALAWVVVWSTLSLSFALLLWGYLHASGQEAVASQRALEFVTGYLIEQSLSIDNMFVFVLIFKSFGVPATLQRRVLIYGVVGAMLLRLIMILAGTWLVSQFAWILYVFGLILVVTGIKMLFADDEVQDIEQNRLLKFLRAHLRITPNFHGEQFFVRIDGAHWVTPLFIVVLMIEASDVIFAVDSIPAIFAVTLDPFIVFTSNMFAIMGLRALYFLIADMAERFHLLKYGLALILVFIGSKMLIVKWLHVPIGLSLAVVGLILGISLLLSIISTKGKKTTAG